MECLCYIFGDSRAEYGFAETRRAVDPEHLRAGGELWRNPVQERGPLEDPIAGALEAPLQGVFVALVEDMSEPRVQLSSRVY